LLLKKTEVVGTALHWHNSCR